VSIFPKTGFLFWPDIDVYFKGDVDVAEGLIRKLKTGGATWIKGALIHRADLCLDDDSETSYFVPGKGLVPERYRDIVERHVVSLALSRHLYGLAKEEGLRVALSVYDSSGIEAALDLGTDALKIPSTNIVHGALIRDAAGTRLPLVIDTGKATFAEIARAVDWARDAGAEDLLLQHSPAGPPAPTTEHALNFMQVLGETFKCPYGLSDHHSGVEMLYAAAALGAAVLEKGVCDDFASPDIDIAHALRVGHFKSVLETCQTIAGARGIDRQLPRSAQHPARMGLVSARRLFPGDKLSRETVDFAWPARGVPVEHFDLVVGWVARRELPGGQVIAWSDIAPDG
jgi:sialic acid synthase SpsE